MNDDITILADFDSALYEQVEPPLVSLYLPTHGSRSRRRERPHRVRGPRGAGAREARPGARAPRIQRRRRAARLRSRALRRSDEPRARRKPRRARRQRPNLHLPAWLRGGPARVRGRAVLRQAAAEELPVRIALLPTGAFGRPLRVRPRRLRLARARGAAPRRARRVQRGVPARVRRVTRVRWTTRRSRTICRPTTAGSRATT